MTPPRGLGTAVLAVLAVAVADLLVSSNPAAAQQSYLQRQRRRDDAKRWSMGPEVPKDRENQTAWYPHFPRCDSKAHALLEFPGGARSEKCVRLPLHPAAKRAAETTAAPGMSGSGVDYGAFPAYVFMLGTAYGGTTSLLGMLSSSPNVTFPSSGWAHEAHWQLTNKMVFPFLKRSQLRYMKARKLWEGLRDDPTVDMHEMEAAWEDVWDKSRSVRVDKSHHLIHLAPQIYTHFRAKGSFVKFVVLVRHPCTYSGRRAQQVWLREALRFRRILEEYPDDSILVQFEDFVEDPQRVAARLVRFFPQFGSMDASRSNLSAKSTTLQGNNPRAGDRGQAIGGENNAALKEKYLYSRMRGRLPRLQRSWCEGFPPSRKIMTNDEGLDTLRFFGYLEPARRPELL